MSVEALVHCGVLRKWTVDHGSVVNELAMFDSRLRSIVSWSFVVAIGSPHPLNLEVEGGLDAGTRTFLIARVMVTVLRFGLDMTLGTGTYVSSASATCRKVIVRARSVIVQVRIASL